MNMFQKLNTIIFSFSDYLELQGILEYTFAGQKSYNFNDDKYFRKRLTNPLIYERFLIFLFKTIKF